uniref:Uncharacterized protein n=1 Tax=Bracon brevicornis TaxID=1563983 RepID=A0A6V7JIP1_9HYME
MAVCQDDNLKKAIDALVPMKVVRMSSTYKPWVTGDHSKLLAERDRLYRVFGRIRDRAALFSSIVLLETEHMTPLKAQNNGCTSNA